MKNQLKIHLYHLPHPYPEERQSGLEAWGRLSIRHVDSQNSSRMLLDTEWNLLPFIRWYEENRVRFFSETLYCEHLRLSASNSESLAQALNRLQDTSFLEEEASTENEWYQFLYQYRLHHSLRFALRGTQVPEIILGKNGDHAEISLADGNEAWSYHFDIDDFFDSTLDEIESFRKTSVGDENLKEV